MRTLVTGGTSGIGLATGRHFLKNGCTVVIADLNQQKGEQTVRELQTEGFSNALFCTCDVANNASVAHLHDFIMERIDGIDCIVNNAGIFASGMLHETEEEAWEKIFAVDVKSIYLTAKYFIPYMLRNGGGSIVNTASISGLQGDYNMAAYNAAKGAVVNLGRAMALDYGKYNIRVNNVCPSACATPMFLSNPPEVIEAFTSANPLKRICTPEEVAAAIYFLASDAASSCNGVNLEVSGGMNVHSGQPVQ